MWAHPREPFATPVSLAFRGQALPAEGNAIREAGKRCKLTTVEAMRINFEPWLEMVGVRYVEEGLRRQLPVEVTPPDTETVTISQLEFLNHSNLRSLGMTDEECETW